MKFVAEITITIPVYFELDDQTMLDEVIGEGGNAFESLQKFALSEFEENCLSAEDDSVSLPREMDLEELQAQVGPILTQDRFESQQRNKARNKRGQGQKIKEELPEEDEEEPNLKKYVPHQEGDGLPNIDSFTGHEDTEGFLDNQHLNHE